MSADIPKAIKLRVFTPLKLLVDEEVEEVFLPSLDGYIGILPGHRNLIVALGKGRLTFRNSGGQKEFAVDGGYAEIFPDRVAVFTGRGKDEPERAGEGRR